MKKIHLWLFALFFPLWVSQAQVIVKSTDELTDSEIQKLSLSTDAPEITLPPYDYRMLQEENKEATLGKPFQFGKAHEMNIGLKDGKWYEEESQRRWKLKISSRDAYSINLIFDKLILPDGAELYIYDQGRTVIMGPINHGNSDGSDEFWTELLPGSGIILELIGHNEALEQASLNISRVIHGFIDTFSIGFGQSAPCNIDIDCPVGMPFSQESNAVARLLIDNGERFCSGAMVNNTCLDFTPYLLTADHCLDPGVSNWVFRFQYRSPNPRCDGQGGGTNNPINIFYNGAVVRANRWESDFALLELNTRSFHPELSYLGWSRTIAGITNTAGIYHPRGDLMKISIDNGVLVQINLPTDVDEVVYPTGNLWGVDFDMGTVEGGSSGSPLLDQNRRVIGQLLGGTTFDIFGNPVDRCLFTDGI